MTIHVLMPVFNRLKLTQAMIECLRAQRVDEPLSIVVVDDGSTDGTTQFLGEQTDIAVLHGDGSLWWGGAIDLGLSYLMPQAGDEDWILFVNNDTTIDGGFIQALLDAARSNAPAAVGCVIRDVEPPHQLLSIGPRINAWTLRVTDLFNDLGNKAAAETVEVDALSGRGVLYPVKALRRVNGMRPRLLPHYLADYELAVRVKAAGWKLLVSTVAAVYSKDEYGNAFRASSWKERLFSVRSPEFLPARIVFWWRASSFMQRLTILPRLLVGKLHSSANRLITPFSRFRNYVLGRGQGVSVRGNGGHPCLVKNNDEDRNR